MVILYLYNDIMPWWEFTRDYWSSRASLRPTAAASPGRNTLNIYFYNIIRISIFKGLIITTNYIKYKLYIVSGKRSELSQVMNHESFLGASPWGEKLILHEFLVPSLKDIINFCCSWRLPVGLVGGLPTTWIRPETPTNLLSPWATLTAIPTSP